MANAVEWLDTQLELFFADWNIWTTFLLFAAFFTLIYPLIDPSEPDTHPLLLSRQASIAPVRYPGESAVYRAVEVPHGFPLKSGLNVKAKGSSRWSAGKDGDIRDIWRRAIEGPTSEDGQSSGPSGEILTVYGKEEFEKHDLQALSRQINTLGSYIKQKNSSCVAIYLPNSVELLTTIFAAAFYGLHPVLLPYDQPQDVVLRLVKMANTDFMVATAGSLPLADIKRQCPDLGEVMWVVEKTSRNVDWSEPSQGASTWHEAVEEPSKSGSVPVALPESKPDDNVPDVITVWQNDTPASGEIVAFTQQNIVAAVAAQISALPLRQRMSPADLFLPTDALTNSYILVQTFAALYSNASVAINSVAGKGVELPLAAMGVSPTIMAASAESALKLHRTTKETISSVPKKFALNTQKSALDSGYMPPASLLSRINTPARVNLGNVPSKLRLMYVFERLHASTPPLGPEELSELRAFTGARVVYALAASKVAGPVTQTHLYDYRTMPQENRKHSHFGVPVSSLEVKTVDADQHKTVEGEAPRGEIVVNGPSVANGYAKLGVAGKFQDDGTLSYI